MEASYFPAAHNYSVSAINYNISAINPRAEVAQLRMHVSYTNVDAFGSAPAFQYTMVFKTLWIYPCLPVYHVI